VWASQQPTIEGGETTTRNNKSFLIFFFTFFSEIEGENKRARYSWVFRRTTTKNREAKHIRCILLQKHHGQKEGKE
jgi:hypothetical protein